MNYQTIPLRLSILLAISTLSCLLLIGIYQIVKTETVLVFCDVGQGDGAYLRIENKIDVLIDAGPSGRILSCLGKYMPFYDKKIEYAFLSHPQKDHYGGFLDILDRYKIGTFVFSYSESESISFKNLREKLESKNAVTQYRYAGTNILFSGDNGIRFLWPTKQFVGENQGLDPNSYSQILLFRLSGREILFTGDILPQQQRFFIDKVEKVEILKVPHHGSKNGLTKAFLEKSTPGTAVISVGRNSYGHPSKEILKMLEVNKVKIRRTDEEGDIVFRF